MIKIENLSFSYGSVHVFSNFSAQIGDGVTYLRGPSGCGKTTLLRLLAGFLKPEKGHISGTPSPVGFMFQENRLLPWFTAIENVAAVLKDMDTENAAYWLRAVEMDDYLQAYPGKLSGGQQRRVALARALAYKCGLLIMDEPFTGLDEALINRIIPVLKSHGIPIIITSHTPYGLDELGANILDLSITNK